MNFRYEDTFDYGIVGHRDEQSITLGPPYWDAVFDSPELLQQSLGLNRLLVKNFVDDEASGRRLTSLAADSPCRGDLAGVLFEIDDLNASALVANPGYRRQAHYLVYLLQEAEYHLVRLAEEYQQTLQRVIDGGFHMPGLLHTYAPVRIADRFPHLAWIEKTGLDSVYAIDVFAALADPMFFEMTACLTSLKRALNQLPVVLNLDPHVKNTFTASFRKLATKRLVRGPQELPAPLVALIERAWADWAESLVLQRDYLEHYAIPSSFDGTPCVHIIFSGDGRAVCTEALLPDNPEARKQADLTFDGGIQYLGYCHGCYDSLLALSREVLTHVHAQVVDSAAD